MKKLFASILFTFLILATLCTVFAAELSEAETSAAFLRSEGIMVGDNTGDMRLEDGLNRAELAVLLTRLHGGTDDVAANESHYAWGCYFIDVPEWAKPFVGYCADNDLVWGYDMLHYGASDPVNPAAACTVVLRACGHAADEGSLWEYSTACSYAATLGLIDASMTEGSAITRGNIAVLICRAMHLQDKSLTEQDVVVSQADAITVADDGIVTEKVITQSAWSREDFSQTANPDIFTDIYSREWYNAIRQSIVDRDIILEGNNENCFNPSYLYAHALVPDKPSEVFSAFSHILGRLYGYGYYGLGGEPYTTNQYEYPGYGIVKVYTSQGFDDASAFIRPKLDSISGMSNAEKVSALNNYLCDHMAYDSNATAAEHEIFSKHTAPVAGKCSSYASAFSFLCGAADIPCIIVSSDDHSWNEVYVDGQWLVVDVSANDVNYGRETYLLTDRSPGEDRMPEVTQFARELSVPGSTIE